MDREEARHAAGTTALRSGGPGTEAQRWAAWRERGVAHDRGVRRKMTIIVPIAAAATALAVWVFV